MRVYRFRDLKGAGVPFSRKHITSLERAGEFPRHFDIGVHSVCWVAEEVDRWVQDRVRRRRSVSGGNAELDSCRRKPTGDL
jgi:predicted DNA-binding transcriptional regulator AlpA